jgi:uracil-DNA glycosylase family 4
MYADQDYWGRPVPSLGGRRADLFVLGLAPAAHGANRTGRMFTGDSSGDWLFRALHRYGFATQAASTARDDGLELVDCVISAAAHCAPPDNKPSREELDHCRGHLRRELEILRPRLVLVLGRIAWESWYRLQAQLDPGPELPSRRPAFGHGNWVELDASRARIPPVLQSYHPSRQNTNTGRLTRRMWHAIFRKARKFLDSAPA